MFFFQNAIETMLLYYQMEEEEIMDFYIRAFEILKKKNFRLLYLDTSNLEETILQVKKRGWIPQEEKFGLSWFWNTWKILLWEKPEVCRGWRDFLVI